MESFLFALNTLAVVIVVVFSVRDDNRGRSRGSSGPFRYTEFRREEPVAASFADRLRNGGAQGGGKPKAPR